jgi:hypothetical protein
VATYLRGLEQGQVSSAAIALVHRLQAGGGGFQVANSGTDFSIFPRHNSGEGTSLA